MTKIRSLFILYILFFIAFLVKLFVIQISHNASYSADYIRTSTIHPTRGRILDRHLEPLAVNEGRYRLFAEPKLISDASYYAHKIDEVLHVGEATLEARMNSSGVWASVQSDLSKEEKQKIEGLSLKGLGFDEEYRRYYPEGSLAAHLLGFVGKKSSGEDVGYFGIEGYYDQDLIGLPGVFKSERDLLNRPIFFGLQQKVDAQNGRDLIVSMDKNIQLIVKNHLREGVDQFKAKSGCVIAVKPATMEILALVCLPDFDPALYSTYPDDVFKMWMLSSEYEPGSTFKPLVMAAAIDEKKVKPDDVYDESGPVTIGGYTIRNWNNKYEGPITHTHILEKSSNVGMVQVGARIGKKNLYSVIRNYGFGQKTGIDLQGEAQGSLKPIEEWYPIDEATMAFGQGISSTGIQLVRAFASIINGGYLMKPFVVRGVINQDGSTQYHEPVVERQVISARTSAIMRKMLVSTVAHAEAKWNIPEGYTFGGKTGTAQIALDGKYDASKTVASFIGFVPAQKPEILMLVVINQPESSSWGSETAAPLFFDIARDVLIYLNIPRE